MLLSFVPLIQSLQDLKSIAMRSSKQYNKKLGEQQHMLTNIIDLRLSTRMLQEQSYIMARWDDLALETEHKAFGSFFFAATYGVVLSTLNWLLYIFGIMVFLMAYNNRQVTLQELVAANGYLVGLVSPLNGWANSFNKMLLFAGPVEKLSSLLDGNQEISAASQKYPRSKKTGKERPETSDDSSTAANPDAIGVEITVDKSSPGGGETASEEYCVKPEMVRSYTQGECERDSPDVIVENAVFTFPGAESPALDNLSLQIPASCFAALVGPSGSGKTTLLRSLGRADDRLSSGRILVGGIDPVSYQHTSICLQSFVTLNASVRENITFGSCYNSHEDVVRAATAAEIHQGIMNLKDRYDTIIGSASNISLSGGQLARLGLARALCRRPRLLLCDEITSPLDSVTEVAVLQTLKNLHQHQRLTIVLCTHSLQAAAVSERVYVMVNGKLGQEPGPFNALSEIVDSPLYKLVNANE